MYLINRKTIRFCLHLLQTRYDELIKDGVRSSDKEGNMIEEPIISLKQAIEDLIRYDAFITLMKLAIEDAEEV